MRKIGAAAAACMLIVLAGCGRNNIVGHEITRTNSYFGDFRVYGNNNVVTIDRYSNLGKLGILGDGNQIMVEQGARLLLIEFFGSDNVVSLPDSLIVPTNEIGHRNQVVHRPHESQATRRSSLYTPLPRREYDHIRVRVVETPAEAQPADVVVEAPEDANVTVDVTTPEEPVEETVEPVLEEMQPEYDSEADPTLK